MSKTLGTINPATDTFDQWLSKTTDMLTAFTTTVGVAANSTGEVSTGNAAIVGSLSANSLVAVNELRGGSLASAGPLNVTSNAVLTGAQVNSTSNTYTVAANVYTISNTFVVGSNSTINAISVVGNSTVTTLSLKSNTFTLQGNSTFSNVATFSANVSVSGNVAITGELSLGSAGVYSGVVTAVSGSSNTIIDTFNTSTYRGCKYVISIKDNSFNNYQLTEILLLQDGTDTFITEYATLKNSSTTLGTVVANVNAGAVRLWLNPIVVTGLTVRVSKNLIVA